MSSFELAMPSRELLRRYRNVLFALSAHFLSMKDRSSLESELMQLLPLMSVDNLRTMFFYLRRANRPSFEILAKFIECGAVLNGSHNDFQELTPLQLVISDEFDNSVELVRLLINHGAGPRIAKDGTASCIKLARSMMNYKTGSSIVKIICASPLVTPIDVVGDIAKFFPRELYEYLRTLDDDQRIAIRDSLPYLHCRIEWQDLESGKLDLLNLLLNDFNFDMNYEDKVKFSASFMLVMFWHQRNL